MLLDGQWSPAYDGGFELKLGNVFYARVKQRGDEGIYSNHWIAVLNNRQVTESADLAYAKGYVEWEIVKELTNLSTAYRVLKARAPTSSDLFPFGAWARFKQERGLSGVEK